MSKTMKYKGYVGTAEVSLNDGCLVGKVLFIKDLLLYSGDTLDQLREAFEIAVDGYLEDCRELGREPGKPLTGSFNVRISPEQHQALVERAIDEHEGVLNRAVVEAVEQYLQDSKHQRLEISMIHHNEYSATLSDTELAFNDHPWQIDELKGAINAH